jgi:hypothetical protein
MIPIVNSKWNGYRKYQFLVQNVKIKRDEENITPAIIYNISLYIKLLTEMRNISFIRLCPSSQNVP